MNESHNTALDETARRQQRLVKIAVACFLKRIGLSKDDIATIEEDTWSILTWDLQDIFRTIRVGDIHLDAGTNVQDTLRALISTALDSEGGNRAAAARNLGIKRTTLVAYLKRLDTKNGATRLWMR